MTFVIRKDISYRSLGLPPRLDFLQIWL